MERVRNLKNSIKLWRLIQRWNVRLKNLSSENQNAFLEDIADAANNRFKVLERAKN